MKNLLTPKILAFFFLFASWPLVQVQAHNIYRDSFRIDLQVGVHILLGWKANPTFSYSVGGQVTYYDQELPWISPSLGISTNVYKGTVGTSNHPSESNDLIVDLIGSAFISGGSSRGNKYDFQRIDKFQPYSTNSIQNRYDRFSMTIGTSFIVNNKKRNQQIGHLGLSVWDISLMYYNDGGPPVENLSLGDKYDRWWTGGLHLSVHPRKWSYFMSATYHVYTGYSKDAYEVSTLMNMDAVLYGNTGEYFLNKGLFTVEIQNYSGFGFGLDFSGNKLMFLQNFIHTSRDVSLHPSIKSSQLKGRLFYNPSFLLKSL